MPSAHSRTRSASHARTEICRSVGTWQKSLAGLAIKRGDQARAWQLFEESLAIHRDLDDAWGVSHSLSNLSFLALEAGDAETARTLLSEALAIERESGHQPRLANALDMSARLAAADGQPALAIRLYARAALLRERVHGLTFEVGWPDPTPNLDDLRSRIGEERFEEQWARGRAMSLIDAIDQAMGEQRELRRTRRSHGRNGRAQIMLPPWRVRRRFERS